MGHSRSAISGLLLLFCFSLLGFNGGSVSALYFVSYNCPNTTLFTPNSTYRRNLDSLLDSLSSNASRPSGFYNLSAGDAYGLFLCRGDLSAAACEGCVATAVADLRRLCPNQRTALLWYDECRVRYSNRSFFSEVATSPSAQLLYTRNSSDPVRFMEFLGATVRDTAERAAADRSGRRFAVGEAEFTAFQRVYTMAQCTADLSSDDCYRCLDEAIGYLPSCCNGKLGGRVLFPSCTVRFETAPFYNRTFLPPPPSPPPVLALPPRTQASPPEEKGKGKISGVTILAIVVPLNLVCVILFFIGYCIVKRRAKKQYSVAVQEHNDGDEISNVESLQFDLSTIEAATNNFSSWNRLGAGGFGEVFKGVLPSGELIAVKRLSKSSSQGAEEFKNEVVLVAKLQHRSLVRLLGFCLEGQEKILVYEFMPNKSLDYFLFDPEKQALLGWSLRYKIIGGVARGILYLHEDSQLRIIHRDLKASNILLDREMNPKISDFGMARIFGVDQTQGNTSRVVGTFGYMSPEYAMQGNFSVKSDMYSFGVLILEIISGKKCSSFHQEGANDLISYAWKLWRDETPLAMVDPILRDSYSSNEVVRCIHIALLCVQEDPTERPSMASVVLMLNSYSVTLALPQQPTPFRFGGSQFSSTRNDGSAS